MQQTLGSWDEINRKWRNTALLLGWLVLAPSSSAATFWVGNCHASSYPTISAAVTAAPAGSTVNVCPGTYPEQVFITRPLTLHGVTSGNNGRAIIAVPASVTGGPPNWQFVPDPTFINLVAPQIFVNSPAGSVVISNLTIDGSGEHGAPSACPPGTGQWQTVAIFFENSSGTINEVTTRGQGKTSGCGVGIRAYAMPGPPATLKITNNSTLDANLYGYRLEAPLPGASLSVTATKNNVEAGSTNLGSFALSYTGGVSGSISSNYIQAVAHGVWGNGQSGDLTFSANTIVSLNGLVGTGGLYAAPATNPGHPLVTGNRVVNFYVGLGVPSGASAVNNNVIVNNVLGMELGCNSAATISGNTINNSQYGYDTVPNGFVATGKVSFFNVDNLNEGTVCP